MNIPGSVAWLSRHWQLKIQSLSRYLVDAGVQVKGIARACEEVLHHWNLGSDHVSLTPPSCDPWLPRQVACHLSYAMMRATASYTQMEGTVV